MNETNPIRVLQVIGTMNYGGAETLLMELYRYIDRTKVQFDFWVYNYGDHQGAYDAEILNLGGFIFYAKKRLYREPLAYRREIQSFCHVHHRYKIIHSHLNMRGGFVLPVFKKAWNCITIAHSHTAFPYLDIKNKCVNNLGRWLLKGNTDYFFGCSEDALKTICESTSKDNNCFVLRNAIDVDKFSFRNEKRDTFRKELCIDDNTFVLCNVARFTEEKNHQFQIDIFEKLLKKNKNCVLLLIGNGDLKSKMEEYTAERLGNDASKVIFLGSRKDVNELLNACDMFLFPSKGEGLGIVLIEAQANGLPCVISKDVIPEEADVHSGLVTRVSLDSPINDWVEACLNVPPRLEPSLARKSVLTAGYDIKSVAKWLEQFYLKVSND